jgi:adenine deaminase
MKCGLSGFSSERSASMTNGYVHQRTKLSEVTQAMVATAMGREPADLIIKNARLLNVNTARIQERVDIVVRHGLIALVGDAEHIQTSLSTKVVDAAGRYALPGFIDTHDHVESSMVDIRNFAAAVLPHGTTTIACDNHELTNVFGVKAVQLFHDAAEGLPLKVLVAMPVCVPSIPGFEDAGAMITAEDVAEAYAQGWAALQGEQMNFPGLIYGDPGVHAITQASLAAGKVLTGHYASTALDEGLNAFVAAGITADHECTTAEGAMRRAQLGCYVQQRYGSAWLDMPNLVRAVTENPGLDTRFFALVTDDVTPATVVNHGHLDRVVREAIRQGLSPIQAVQMVTLNAAQLLERSREIGTLSPGRAADILIVSDLVAMKVDQVYCDGVLVAENGKLVVEIAPYEYPDWAIKSMHLEPLTSADFAVTVPGDAPVKVRVMRAVPGRVHTEEVIMEMAPVDGALQVDPDRDLMKAAIFYRHAPQSGGAEDAVKGTRMVGFVTGLQFNPGAAMASTVSHDSHNLLVVGSDEDAMVRAANAVLALNGGMAVVANGELVAELSLPVGGLMALDSAAVVAERVEGIEAGLKAAGCPYDSVEMTISLLGLIVIEELHLSNRGLVALKPGQPPKFVDLVVES